MKYIALLRGINAGKERRVEMKKLKSIFEALGYTNVVTYINSGNIIFETKDKKEDVHKKVSNILKQEFSFEIPILIKTKKEIEAIFNAIPENWLNDKDQKTDVAYLFSEIDYKKIIEELPIDREFIDIRYTKGVIFWNVKRENYNKSYLNKIISHKLYKNMTVRNVNTARYLANIST